MKALLLKIWAFVCMFLILTCEVIPWLVSNNMMPMPIIITLMTIIISIVGCLTCFLSFGMVKEIMNIIDKRSSKEK